MFVGKAQQRGYVYVVVRVCSVCPYVYVSHNEYKGGRAMQAKSVFLLFSALAVSQPTIAAVCNEKVTKVITHQDGNIYFQTDKTCSGAWCMINWGTAEKNKQGYAMLITAKTSGASIDFQWPALNNCSLFNSFSASPEFMGMY